MKQRQPRRKKISNRSIDNVIPRTPVKAEGGYNSLRTTEDEAVSEIDNLTKSDNVFRLEETQSKPKKHRSMKKIIKRTVVILIILALLLTGYLGLKFWWTTRKVIDDSTGGAPALSSSDVSPAALSKEGDGRINILIIGIGGEGHDGGDLSDTNLIATIDPRADDAGIFSIPRDTWVNIPNYYESRINTAHSIGESTGYDEGDIEGGIGLLVDTIESNFEIPIHYYIRADLSGFESAVDAVNGIEYFVEETLVDFIYSDAELGYPGPFTVEEGFQQFDGERALLYARSRSTSPRGDFDRNDRQRDILLALKDKALSVGTFSDPRKISSLLSAASNNVRTNIQFGEFKPLYDLASRVDSGLVKSIGLSTDTDNFLQDANIGGASVLIPSAGAGDYSEITDYFFSNFPDTYLTDETPTVAIYNATLTPGYAGSSASLLDALGYTIVSVDNLEGDFVGNSVYKNTSEDKLYTENYLEKRFDTTVLSSSQIPTGVNTIADYIIVLGEENQETQSQQ